MRQHGTGDQVSNGVYGRNIRAIVSVHFYAAGVGIGLDPGFLQTKSPGERPPAHTHQQSLTGYLFLFVFCFQRYPDVFRRNVCPRDF